MTTTLTKDQAKAIAEKADCDARSVMAYVAGWKQRPLLVKRIERALVETGHGELVRREPGAGAA